MDFISINKVLSNWDMFWQVDEDVKECRLNWWTFDTTQEMLFAISVMQTNMGFIYINQPVSWFLKYLGQQQQGLTIENKLEHDKLYKKEKILDPILLGYSADKNSMVWGVKECNELD